MDECSSSSPSMTTRVSLRVISALIIRTEFIQCSGANFQPQLKGSWEVEGADASCLYLQRASAEAPEAPFRRLVQNIAPLLACSFVT
jgi:hypothetical protein